MRNGPNGRVVETAGQRPDSDKRAGGEAACIGLQNLLQRFNSAPRLQR
jgi:hypothetical protein